MHWYYYTILYVVGWFTYYILNGYFDYIPITDEGSRDSDEWFTSVFWIITGPILIVKYFRNKLEKVKNKRIQNKKQKYKLRVEKIAETAKLFDVSSEEAENIICNKSKL